MRRETYFLALIIAAAVLAGFFIYPTGFGANVLPWRLGLDLVGGSRLVFEVDLTNISEGDRTYVLNGLRDVIERRVNIFGVSEPQVYIAESGERAQLVAELAGIKDVSQAISQIGDTPLLDFREVEQVGSSTEFIHTNLNGSYVAGAQLSRNPNSFEYQIELSFNEEGAGIFEKITEANIGKPLAVFLDNELLTAPVVQNKIPGGKAVITGQFSLAEARQLVERFNAGALPAPIHLIDQRTVSASLGENSLRQTIVAGAIGTALVALFMILYYGRLGIISALALAVYILFSLAVFKLIPVFTMTLAGVAGFVITIGMAVDANILVFERMKEERKRGLAGGSTVQEGFRRAWPSIRDSNTTTILTAIILYFFTSSFVRGFALTLLIGTAVSMFSAITTTRVFLDTLGGWFGTEKRDA